MNEPGSFSKFAELIAKPPVYKYIIGFYAKDDLISMGEFDSLKSATDYFVAHEEAIAASLPPMVRSMIDEESLGAYDVPDSIGFEVAEKWSAGAIKMLRPSTATLPISRPAPVDAQRPTLPIPQAAPTLNIPHTPHLSISQTPKLNLSEQHNRLVIPKKQNPFEQEYEFSDGTPGQSADVEIIVTNSDNYVFLVFAPGTDREQADAWLETKKNEAADRLLESLNEGVDEDEILSREDVLGESVEDLEMESHEVFQIFENVFGSWFREVAESVDRQETFSLSEVFTRHISKFAVVTLPTA